MKKIFICSPFRGDVKGNREKASRYCRKAYGEGCIPIAPHLMFPQFLNEDSLKERMDGISMGLKLMQECDEVWVYGKTTDGMAQEVKFAVEHGIPVWFKEIQEGGMPDEAGNGCNKDNG